MVEIIAVANLKGGVGKSTIAVNLACCLRGPDRTSVVIDADSQGTSSFWSNNGGLPVGLRAMPLEDHDREGWLRRLWRRKRVQNGRLAQEWFGALGGIDANYLVIDCPPHVGLATQAAVWVADLVLVPVTASAADVSATRPALELIAQARTARRDKGPKCMLVPSRIDRSTATGRTIESILKHLGEEVGPAIAQRVAFADSVAFGKWIGDYAPNSAAHREVIDLAYSVRRVLREKPKAR